MKSKRPVVGVFGHYGNRNLGDESIITATLEQLREHLPNPELICFSLRPNDTAFRYEVEAYGIRRNIQTTIDPVYPTDIEKKQDVPWKTQADKPISNTKNEQLYNFKERLKQIPCIGLGIKALGILITGCRNTKDEIAYLRRSRNYLKRFDLLVVTGSNQFLDNFGGTWGFPYTLLKWSILAKITNTKLAYVSVGAGPLNKPMSKHLIRLALNFSHYISFRDSASKDLVESKSWKTNGGISPDLAHGLHYQKVEKSLAKNSKPTIGINPMPMYDPRYWCEADKERYLSYVGKLTDLVRRLVEDDYPVFLFCTMWRDEAVVLDILEGLSEQVRSNVTYESCLEKCNEVHDLMALLQKSDMVIATRFHGILLALHAERPVVGISYYRKSEDLMCELGQSDYCEALDDLNVEEVWTKLKSLEKNLTQEKDKIRKINYDYKKKIEKQWENVVGLIDID